MKVLLIRPVPSQPSDSDTPPIGLGYLATNLRKIGIEPELWDLANGDRVYRRFLTRMRSADDVSLAGIQVYSRDIESARRLLAQITPRLSPKAVVALGGPHPSVAPEHALDYLKRADVAFMGEAERSFTELARQLQETGEFSREQLAGLAWMESGSLRTNPQDFCKDLDSLGHPAWDLIPPSHYHAEMLSGFTKRIPAAVLPTGRGCPMRCTFCSARSIDGHMPRKHSVSHLLEDIELFCNKYGVREIRVIDDAFTVNKNYVLNFCETVSRSGFDVVFSLPIGVHINTLDEQVLDALKTIGVYNIQVALESGSQRIVDAMKKHIQLDEAVDKIRLIAAKGFLITCYFIIGYKDETVEDLKKSIRLSLRLPLARIHINSFLPFPGTEVFDQLVSEGKIKDIPWHLQHFETVNCSFAQGLSQKELTRWRIWWLIRFYILRPTYGFRLLTQVKNAKQFFFILKKSLEYFGVSKWLDRFRRRKPEPIL